MHALTTMIMATVAFQSAFASPAPEPTTYLGTLPGDEHTLARREASTLPGDVKSGCLTPTTTITTTPIRFGVCPACLVPTSSCSAGEPTGPTPRPPVTSTLSVSSGACTETVSVLNNPGCGNCPTCTTGASGPVVTGRWVQARADLEARQTTLPGGDWCSPTATVTTEVGPQTTEICACPAVLSSCSYGQPTAPPLPTTTLTEGCVESIVIGPGSCRNLCPTCAY